MLHSSALERTAILFSPPQVFFLLQIVVVTIHCFIIKKNNNYIFYSIANNVKKLPTRVSNFNCRQPTCIIGYFRYFQPMKIVLTFQEHHCVILPRMQLLHMHHKIIEYASQDFRIYITRFSNIHHKILNIHHKIIEYTSQDFEHTSQDFRIYITRF